MNHAFPLCFTGNNTGPHRCQTVTVKSRWASIGTKTHIESEKNAEDPLIVP